ncbi:BRCA1 carboxy-terminus (BRCT) domain protein [Ceratobasidium sp. AG-Ba]|nr:BRCA1 carboxy-terminus (BRCT) domain protein [Ceratobasidium sp. AG-Ba]
MGDPGPSGGGATLAGTTLFSRSAPNDRLHFHIHTAIPSKLKAELSNGGKVHKRLIDLHHPFYALVHPGSPRLPEYATYVSTREPPTERGTVVPYSFVRSSIVARRLLDPAEFQAEPDASHADANTARAWAPLALTRGSRRQSHGPGESARDSNRSTGDQAEGDDDGWGGLEPVTVHLHTTLAQDQRSSLAVKISKAGGDPTSSITAARVIVANEDHAEFAQLKKRYEHSLNTYVEPPSWVERCLVKGRYFHDSLQKAPMGGRKPGADRNDFTTEDDSRLAQFIAKRIPNKTDGGRTGNNLYKDLCDRTDIYPWAAAHTWQSWRNRYRKKQEYFDPIIDDYAAKRQHSGDGKGEYGYSRGKKRTAREDSPASASADDREKRRRPSKEATSLNRRDQHEARASTSTNDPKRIRQTPRQPNSGSQERIRPSGAQGSNGTATQQLRHAAQRGAADTGRGTRRNQTERARSVAATRVGPNESAPQAGVMDATLDPDANRSNVNGHAPTPGGGLDLSSTYYGYDESDRDVHDKARDLGLSDYLAQGFTSTW